MKQKEEKAPSKNSLRTLLLFCVVVFAVLVISLCYRIFLLIKDSKFDGESGFIVAILQDDGIKANIFAFDPRGEGAAVLQIANHSGTANLQQSLAIPFDAVIKRKTISDRKEFPLELASYSLYNPKEHTDLSVLDVVRLWWLFRSIPERNRVSEAMTLPQDEAAFDSKLSSLFLDTRLEDEKQSIAIVNGTVVSGLGGRLERLLSRVGGSVISITTAHKPVPHSRIIYYGRKSYTVDRLARILSYPIETREGSNVSDIVIEIGNDEQRTSKY